jgi:hypothetical protein
MHSIFHSEHNRLVDAYKDTILGPGNLATLNEWLRRTRPADSLPVAEGRSHPWCGTASGCSRPAAS